MTEMCRTCRFAEPVLEDGKPSTKEGFCLRYPPHAIAANQSTRPVIKLEWWCGEYQAVQPAVTAKRRTR